MKLVCLTVLASIILIGLIVLLALGHNSNLHLVFTGIAGTVEAVILALISYDPVKKKLKKGDDDA